MYRPFDKSLFHRVYLPYLSYLNYFSIHSTLYTLHFTPYTVHFKLHSHTFSVHSRRKISKKNSNVQDFCKKNRVNLFIKVVFSKNIGVRSIVRENRALSNLSTLSGLAAVSLLSTFYFLLSTLSEAVCTHEATRFPLLPKATMSPLMSHAFLWLNRKLPRSNRARPRKLPRSNRASAKKTRFA